MSSISRSERSCEGLRLPGVNDVTLCWLQASPGRSLVPGMSREGRISVGRKSTTLD